MRMQNDHAIARRRMLSSSDIACDEACDECKPAKSMR